MALRQSWSRLLHMVDPRLPLLAEDPRLLPMASSARLLLLARSHSPCLPLLPLFLLLLGPGLAVLCALLRLHLPLWFLLLPRMPRILLRRLRACLHLLTLMRPT